MNKYINYLKMIFIIGVYMSSGVFEQLSGEQIDNTLTPKYLYKVLGLKNWQESQALNLVILAKEDNEFIHFSKEDQLSRITTKYWSKIPEYVILKIDVDQLPGNLVFEANEPGGNKYYHLYDGAIPLKAVIESKIIKSTL